MAVSALKAGIVAIVVAVLTIITRNQLLDVAQIHGDSMTPFLRDSQFRLFRPIAPHGDIALLRGEVVLASFDGKRVVVKRIVGVASDTIVMKNGILYTNGIPEKSWYDRSEPWITTSDGPIPNPAAFSRYINISHDGHDSTTATHWGAVIVPPNSIFLMGDNRRNSGDSRRFGTVNISSVLGRLVSARP